MLYNKITCFCFAWNFRYAPYMELVRNYIKQQYLM